MPLTVINGTTYYGFGASVWVTRNPDGSARFLENAPIALFTDETGSTALSVLTPAGQPFTPVTDASGQLPRFLAPQYDTVFGDGGYGLQPIVCLDFAEVINQLAATIAQQVLDLVDPRIAANEGKIAALGALPSLDDLQDLQDGLQALQAEVTALPHRNAQGVLNLSDLGIYVTTTTDADVPGAKAEAAAQRPAAHTLFIPDV